MFDVARAQELYAEWFAPWVRALDLRFEQVGGGRSVARLPANSGLTRGPDDIVSGQAIMAAVDTVMVMASISAMGEEIPTTTVSQTTNFLRPLPNADALVDVTVRKTGRTLVYGDASVCSTLQPEVPAATATLVYAILRR